MSSLVKCCRGDHRLLHHFRVVIVMMMIVKTRKRKRLGGIDSSSFFSNKKRMVKAPMIVLFVPSLSLAILFCLLSTRCFAFRPYACMDAWMFLYTNSTT